LDGSGNKTIFYLFLHQAQTIGGQAFSLVFVAQTTSSHRPVLSLSTISGSIYQITTVVLGCVDPLNHITTTAAGKLILGIFEVLSEFEHEMFKEHTLTGMALARGRKGGRPYKMTPENLRLAMASLGKLETKIGPLFYVKNLGLLNRNYIDM
jgi:hypothetical protein